MLILCINKKRKETPEDSPLLNMIMSQPNLIKDEGYTGNMYVFVRCTNFRGIRSYPSPWKKIGEVGPLILSLIRKFARKVVNICLMRE